MVDNPCKNVTKANPSVACEMYKKRRIMVTGILIAIGILFLFASFFFTILLVFVLPIIGVIMLVMAVLIGFGVINVDQATGYSESKSKSKK